MSSTQKAVVITQPKVGGLVTDRNLPSLRSEHVLVKTVSVGLNPTDWKHIEFLSPPGVLVGCDYAGIVEAVGKDVKKPWKAGDRICGFTHGANAVQPEDGAFAEYIVAKGDLQLKIPDHMTFQEAATLGLGINTVGQALYQSLKISLPNDPTKDEIPILVYGGSTATGALAIQFAKLSGYRVLTTCSPHNFDLLRSLGADAVFDYKEHSSAIEIRKDTGDDLKLVLDCIALPSSAEFCANAISTKGGEYSSLLNVQTGRENVNHHHTMAYTSIGEPFKFGSAFYPASPEDLAYSTNFISIAQEIIDQGKIQVHSPRVGKNGLRGVLEGLQTMKNGGVSGEKLVYNVVETD